MKAQKKHLLTPWQSARNETGSTGTRPHPDFQKQEMEMGGGGGGRIQLPPLIILRDSTTYFFADYDLAKGGSLTGEQIFLLT